jgi:hypothetical protein
MTVRARQLAALFLSWMTPISHGAGAIPIVGARLMAPHRLGEGRSSAVAFVDSAPSFHGLTVSTFLVDYPPRASAVLHRWPTHGCVLVYVLFGTIQASAWHAGMGIYRAGETWAAPAFAYSVAAANTSDSGPTRTLVVLRPERCRSDDHR